MNVVSACIYSFRMVGKETSARAARVAWVIRRRSLAARSRAPSSSSWRFVRGNTGGDRLGIENIVNLCASNDKYILSAGEPRPWRAPAELGVQLFPAPVDRHAFRMGGVGHGQVQDLTGPRPGFVQRTPALKEEICLNGGKTGDLSGLANYPDEAGTACCGCRMSFTSGRAASDSSCSMGNLASMRSW